MKFKIRRLLLRLKLAYQAFKHGEMALYGVVVGIEFDGGIMPSEVEACVRLNVIDYNGNRVKRPLKFFGSCKALPGGPTSGKLKKQGGLPW